MAVDFDQWQGEIPYEDWKVRDESMFATFAGPAREALAGAVADPLLDDFWPRVLRRRGEAETVGLRFALARREVEESWGVSNLELPLGDGLPDRRFPLVRLAPDRPASRAIRRCTTPAWRSIARPIASGAGTIPWPRWPVKDDWLEAPFWVWRTSQPRRRRCWLASGRGSSSYGSTARTRS